MKKQKLFKTNAAERCIGKVLSKNQVAMYAFFLLDIDNFKQANGGSAMCLGIWLLKSL